MSVNLYAQSSRELAACLFLSFFFFGGGGVLCCGPVSHSLIVAYKEDSSIVTKNATVVVKRVPAPKTGGLLAKMKALDAAAALQSTATYGYFCRKTLSFFLCVSRPLSLRFVCGVVAYVVLPRPMSVLYVSCVSHGKIVLPCVSRLRNAVRFFVPRR